MSSATWHEVVPKIVDPDLVPRRGGPADLRAASVPGQQNGGAHGFGPQGHPPGAYPPEKPRGFFQEHKVAIIVAVVVLAVVLVVLYLYLSQKGRRGDKGAKGRPPGSFGAAAGDSGDGKDGPGAPEEERINAAEMQKVLMMRQAARAAQQRAGRSHNGQGEGVEPGSFGGPRPPWQGEGGPQMPPPPFEPAYPPYGVFDPRGATPAPALPAPSSREDNAPPTAAAWGQAPPNGQQFAQPRGPPEGFRTTDTQQFHGSGANMATSLNRASSVDISSGGSLGRGPMEQRRVTWADGGPGDGSAAQNVGHPPYGGGVRAPKAPERIPAVGSDSGPPGGSLFQQLAISLEDEASSGQ
jgi:hypothetical protein